MYSSLRGFHFCAKPLSGLQLICVQSTRLGSCLLQYAATQCYRNPATNLSSMKSGVRPCNSRSTICRFKSNSCNKFNNRCIGPQGMRSMIQKSSPPMIVNAAMISHSGAKHWIASKSKIGAPYRIHYKVVPISSGPFTARLGRIAKI